MCIRDSDIGDPLRELGENLRRAVGDGNPLKYSELNRELHRRVGAISGQATAVGLLDRLHAQLVRHQFQLAQRPGRPSQSLPEHLAIIDAVAGRRPGDADEAVRRHLNSVIKTLRAAGDGMPGAAPGIPETNPNRRSVRSVIHSD